MHSFWCRHTSCDFLRKSFSTSENIWKSHYDALGIHPNATQGDVKTAYYKLSKIYHPDKNKGSDSAADKFRDITAAYEVLGNLKLRKMYDKGILYAPEPSFSDNQDLNPQMKDDYEHAKFYHSRNIPNRRTSNTGSRKESIYNFDEWAQQHYGSTFARRNEAKIKYANLSKNNPSVRENDHNYSVCKFGLGLSFFIFIIFHFTFSDSKDTIQNRSSLKDKEKMI